MRILLVSSGYPPQLGGVERHVERLAHAFAALGHETAVVTPAPFGHKGTRWTDRGVDITSHRSYGIGSALRLAPMLWSDLRRHAGSYDVVHVHNFHALPALAAASLRPPLLAFTPHYHGVGHTPFLQLLHTPYRPAARALFKRSDAVICVSRQEASRVAADFPFVAERISVIPNGVDRGAPPVTAGASPTESSRQEILSVGRLEPHKRVAALIESLQWLTDDYILTIVGEGSLGGDLRMLTDRLALGERVRFRGRISDADLELAYASATLVATVSRNEAFGLVLAEALARGRRVLASDIPAHREVAQMSGATGVVFTDVDVSPEELAKMISAVAALPVPSGPARFLSWADVAKATLAVYAETSGRLSN